MSRSMTASQIKGTGRTRRDMPGPSTNAGRVYARLLQGGPLISCRDVDLSKVSFGRAVEELRDYWGCEIKGKPGPRGGSRLVGEWRGAEFVPIHRLMDASLSEPS